jgi:CubicO group peptidase (beta-lactamase class C family)
MTPSVRSRARACLLPPSLALLLLLGQPWSAQPPAQTTPNAAGVSSVRLQRLKATLQEYVTSDRLPGAVTVVARRGQIVYSEAIGLRDREARAPMRTDSIFRIASQTKALVSVGIMQLQEEGKIRISDPVGRYLPEFRKTTVAVGIPGGGYEIVPARRAITIRDLLTHTAGIGYGNGSAADRWKATGIQGWYFADRDEPIADTVARMAALPFDAQPGERFVYGYAIDILGVVIEKVSGQPLDEFIRKRITDPLRMNDTHFYLPATKSGRLAVVYSRTGNGLERAPVEGGMVSQGAYAMGPRKSLSGGAGLLSTAGDYMRFLQALLNGGELDGERILGRKSVELMTVDHIGPIEYQPGVGFGLGFSVLRDLGRRGSMGSVGEFGWGGAYHSTYWVDPVEQLIVVHMSQVIPAGDLDDYATVRALVYSALVDSPQATPNSQLPTPKLPIPRLSNSQLPRRSHLEVGNLGVGSWEFTSLLSRKDTGGRAGRSCLRPAPATH